MDHDTLNLPPPPPPTKLKDLIDGTVITMDEWIKNEIHRLKNNIKPRHFDDYGQLVEMVQEDPNRFQARSAPPPPSPGPIIYSMYSDDEEDDSNMEYMDDEKCCIEDIEDGEDDDEEEEDSNNEEDTDDEEEIESDICMNNNSIHQKQYMNCITETNNSIIPNHNNNYKYINHKQQATMNRQPTWLCRAFMEIMRYCSRTKNSQAPKLLLIEFDKLKHNVKLGKPICVIEFRGTLQTILFGKIQMTENLVKVWRLMCEWVTRPPLDSKQHALKWVNISLNAYIVAQRLFITEVMMLRAKAMDK